MKYFYYNIYTGYFSWLVFQLVAKSGVDDKQQTATDTINYNM